MELKRVDWVEEQYENLKMEGIANAALRDSREPPIRGEKQQKITIALVGLQNSGKSTFLSCLQDEEFTPEYTATDAAPMKRITKGKVTINAWDVGGRKKFRDTLWEKYCGRSDAIVFFVDAAAPDLFPNVNEALNALLLTVPFVTFQFCSSSTNRICLRWLKKPLLDRKWVSMTSAIITGIGNSFAIRHLVRQWRTWTRCWI